MKITNKFITALTLSCSLMLSSFGVSAVPVTQLGFSLDGSGSVSTGNYNLMRTGLNAALAGIPTDGSIEISVVAYGSGTATVVDAVVLTAASLPTIQAAINNHNKAGGTTNTAGSINLLTSVMTGSVNFADPGSKSLINLMTDGAPNSQSASVAAATAASAAGIDALSIEAIGTGVSSAGALANMLAMTFPTPAQILAINATNIPNPIGGSWVVPVSDFTALAPVLAAKVQASITTVPEPSLLALFTIGLMGMGISARRRMQG